MAWEWVAPVCTSAVGLGGVAATYFTARGQRRMTELTFEKQRITDSEKDLRTRRHTAYADALADGMEIFHLATIHHSALRSIQNKVNSGEIAAEQEEHFRKEILKIVGTPENINSDSLNFHRYRTNVERAMLVGSDLVSTKLDELTLELFALINSSPDDSKEVAGRCEKVLKEVKGLMQQDLH